MGEGQITKEMQHHSVVKIFEHVFNYVQKVGHLLGSLTTTFGDKIPPLFRSKNCRPILAKVIDAHYQNFRLIGDVGLASDTLALSSPEVVLSVV